VCSFAKRIAIDKIEIADSSVVFEGLEVKHGFHRPRMYRYSWAIFDNPTESRTLIPGAVSNKIPAGAGEGYAMLQVRAENSAKAVDVYIRKQSGAWKVVGIERHWWSGNERRIVSIYLKRGQVGLAHKHRNLDRA
jgi:hypothetical protein